MSIGSTTDATASRNTQPGSRPIPPPSPTQRPPTPADAKNLVVLVASRETVINERTVFGRTVTGTIGRDEVALSVSPEAFVGGRTVTGTIGRKDVVSLTISSESSIQGREIADRTVTGTIGRDDVSLSISREDVFGARTVTGTIGRKDVVSLTISRESSIQGREVKGRTVTGQLGRDVVSVSIDPATPDGDRSIGGRGPLRASTIVSALI